MAFKDRQKQFFDEFTDSERGVSSPISKFIDEYYPGFIHRQLSNFLKDIKGRVLDIGCGEGQFSRHILESTETLHLVCADLSASSLKKFQKTIDHKDRTRVSLIICDAENLPFKPESFNGMVIVNLMHHLPGFSSIKGFHNVLKASSIMLMVDIVSNNPVLEFGRKVFEYLPLGIKMQFKDDLVLSDGSIPEIFSFKASRLKASVATHFTILEEKRNNLFMFVVNYLPRIIPSAQWVLSPFINILYYLEQRLLKTSIKTFGQMISLKCIKKNL